MNQVMFSSKTVLFLFLLVSRATFSIAEDDPTDPPVDPVEPEPTPQPEQIHLSLGDSENVMVVTWVTLNLTDSSQVKFGKSPDSLKTKVYGKITKYKDSGKLRRVLYINKAKLPVDPGQTYYYKVGNGLDDGWSPVFSFKALLPADNSWQPRICYYGDMGVENNQILNDLITNVEDKNFDLIMQSGDYAYDMHVNDSYRGDDFMNMIQPMVANVPFMTAAGNHEVAYNFSNYIYRFNMPGNNNNLFYSFNVGPAHIIAMDTEFYFSGSNESIQAQYNWLIDDLKQANEPANREKNPWIIIFGHRPLYCSSPDRKECKDDTLNKAYEELLWRYGVDIELWGHIHGYERFWPVYNYTVYNGTTVTGQPYTNPNAPVHLISGAAGNWEGLITFSGKPPAYSAFTASEFGYSTILIANATHINIQYYSVVQHQIIDSFWVVKTAPYPPYYSPPIPSK